MPTTGWILESAQDRYLEGTVWTAPVYVPNLPCPFCDRRFPSQESLLAHLGIEHPVSIPVLMLAGNPLGREFVVRQTPEPAHFLLCNCTACRVIVLGQSAILSPSGLPQWLCEKQPLHAEVELENTRALDQNSAVSRYRIEFRVATPDMLADCDRLFVEKLAIPNPTLGDVDGFRRAIPSAQAAKEYGGALADYVVGVLLKEQARDRGIRGRFESYKDKFMEVLGILSGFPRPLSKAVVTAIEFNLNAWDRIAPPPQMRDFVRAVGFFRNLPDSPGAVAAPDEATSLERAICPLDVVTDRILHVIKWLVPPVGKAYRDHIEGLENLQSRVPIGEFDRLKLNVVGAVAGLLGRDSGLALQYLRQIQFDDRFGAWAKTKIEELSRHE